MAIPSKPQKPIYDIPTPKGGGELADGSADPEVDAPPVHGRRRRGVRGGHRGVREEGQVKNITEYGVNKNEKQ